jgi:hypothetical protein
MAERKTVENDADMDAFLSGVKNETRRKDSEVIARLMTSISGEQPKMWGPSIIGYGRHHYSYADGRPAEICRIGFAPRAQSLVFYLGNFEERPQLLKKLGKHKLSRGGCLYVNKLKDVDLDVLKTVIEKSWRIR